MKGTARRAWLIFAACALVLLAAVAAMSIRIVQSERAQALGEAQAQIEAQVRLALWRLDSRLTPLIASESARAHASFVQPQDEALAPEIKLRFARQDDRLIISAATQSDLASQFGDLLAGGSLDAALPKPTDASPTRAFNSAGRLAYAEQQAGPRPAHGGLGDLKAHAEQAPQTDSQNQAPFAQAVQPAVQAQQIQSDNEYRQRKASLDRTASNYANSVDADFQEQSAWFSRSSSRRALPSAGADLAEDPIEDSSNATSLSSLSSAKLQPASSGTARQSGQSHGHGLIASLEARESVTAALWVKDQLLLARRVSAADGEWIEGTWIDWPKLRGSLLTEIEDLLPQAQLIPVREGPEGTTIAPGRMLATLPIALSPGTQLAQGLTPDIDSATEWALVTAWMVVLFVLGATALLLRGTLDLSERRGAFVSAVTHELRTPLTTFRMYTEMLSENMVSDEAQRAHYLQTLRSEAQRLDSLVQNVLTYARIEDERAQVKVESYTVSDLMGSMRHRLQERAQQANFEFNEHIAEELNDVVLKLDPTALEQVLFNLVDNAAKYGRGDSRSAIEVSVSLGRKGGVVFAVRDWGPGIAPDERAKVFRPFQKADAHAAGTLPGVGLGLALCRRLATALGGQLQVRDAAPGVSFELELPAAR